MLPRRWQFFRVMCLFQMAFAGLATGYALVFVFTTGSLRSLVDALCFTLVFLLAYLGHSLVNYNYPDTTPQGRQKRYFNLLYITNFFLLSFLWAHAWAERWRVSIVWQFKVELTVAIILLLEFVVYALMLALQVYLLYGLFRLRRELYRNFSIKVEELARVEK